MNLQAFTLRDIQIFLALTQLAEAEGVMDVRFLRSRLQDHLTEQIKGYRQPYAAKDARQHPQSAPPECPSCLRDRLVPVVNAEGLKIAACRKCRYSVITG